MELILQQGDYVPDGAGGLGRVSGREALVQRVLFRLTARRGTFPFLPELGSRLHQLGREPRARRQDAARLYVTEALAAEAEVAVSAVELTEQADGVLQVTVQLLRGEEPLQVTTTVR